MVVKSIDVDIEGWKFLSGLKAQMGLKTLADAVNMLVRKWKGEEDPAESESPRSDDAEAAQKKRRINVREPLLSLSLMHQRHGMLQYFTGFERPQVDILIRRFSEVESSAFFFSFTCFGGNH